VVRARRGATRWGCLLSGLLLVTIAYFGINVGSVYLRYYRYQDGMRQEARFSARLNDDDIKRRLASLADSLGLPEAAGKVRVRRTSSHISISAEYYERIEFPLIARDILFTPQAEWTY
jgi:hypothetical protein